jgi:hypothetical protein
MASAGLETSPQRVPFDAVAEHYDETFISSVIGRAQREAVDVGAIKRRHIDRRRDVVRQHAAERIGQRNGLGRQRRQIEMGLESRFRVLGRDDFEELLLPRGGAHGIEQRGFRTAAVVHGNARISSAVPAGKPSLSGGTKIQPSARAIACTGQ